MRTVFRMGAIVLATTLPGFAITITTGTPNSFGTGLAPVFGTLINFDDLAPTSMVNPAAYVSKGITSIQNSPASTALFALPTSTQSPPNYLSTGPSDNYAGDITFTFTNPVSEAGFGIAEDGTTTVTLTAFDANGNILGSFPEVVPSSTFNAYYVLADTTADIKSISVSAPQNLAIDDVQFTTVPEPATFVLAGCAIAAFVLNRRRRFICDRLLHDNNSREEQRRADARL